MLVGTFRILRLDGGCNHKMAATGSGINRRISGSEVMRISDNFLIFQAETLFNKVSFKMSILKNIFLHILKLIFSHTGNILLLW